MRPSTTPPPVEPFQVAPGPWQCKGEMFWFFNYAMGSALYPSRANFGDLEADSPYADPKETGEYKGGLQHIMIVRYKESPVGPYDEIIWSPGKFVVTPIGKAAQRITRIYVSTKESIFNGRRNWNLPKHLAHFIFTPSNAPSPSTLPYSRITIASPSTPNKPFFAVDLTPALFFGTGSIPFSSKLLPIDTDLVHPPVPESTHWHQDAMLGTDRWRIMTLLMKGKAGLFRNKGGLEGGKYGDDEGFPDVQPLSFGMWLRDFELDLPDGKQLKKKYD